MMRAGLLTVLGLSGLVGLAASAIAPEPVRSAEGAPIRFVADLAKAQYDVVIDTRPAEICESGSLEGARCLGPDAVMSL